MSEKITKLQEFLDECYTWKLEYVSNNDDFINGYDYYLEKTIDLERAKRMLSCSTIDDESLLGIIKDNYTIERASYYYPDNALTFVNIDEIEDQVSNISNEETDCIFTELTKDMSQGEIKEAGSRFDYTLKGNCIYFQPDFSSIQLIVDYEVIQSEIDKKFPRREFKIVD